MRILQVFNKYLHTGGEQMAVEQISARLSLRHEVRDLYFESSEWARDSSILSKCKQALLMACNPKSIRRAKAEIEAFCPDLILLHNLMPVGSAYLYQALLAQQTPVIQFIHNFRPFSVNGYCWANGQLCPEGIQRNFLPEIIAGSWQESRIRSAWYAGLLQLQHAAGVYHKIDGWIAISRFMADAFVDAGICPERIEVIPHGWDMQETTISHRNSTGNEPLFLFLGRLSEEKGVKILLDAWRIHERQGLPGRLVIAGEGPLAEDVASRCSQLKRAERLSFVHGEQKQQLLRECTAMVIPSVWWEPLGLVIFEAFEQGKPVLAARSGGIVDHVVHGENGWLHEPGDAFTLAKHLEEASQGRDLTMRLGAAGKDYLKSNTAEVWLDRFDSFAERLMDGKKDLNSNTVHSEEIQQNPSPRLQVLCYLADQNPKLGRSLGISRMTEMLLEQLTLRDDIEIGSIVSRSSIQAPAGCKWVVSIPWSTKGNLSRAITDNLHPFFSLSRDENHLWYFPKGFMPRFPIEIRFSVATIHDTIIQYYQDNYPEWRTGIEYSYWRSMLCNTLTHASAILTVSQHARGQIESFIERHNLPKREIHVTYEPCVYESVPQPEVQSKGDYVLHLGSREPHKRTAWLVRLWQEWTADADAIELPVLHIVGRVPEEVEDLVRDSAGIRQLPFLDDDLLAEQFQQARALIFPSEIEGFGLPAIEAYYLGTPACFARGTSVEEILDGATDKGGFLFEDPGSLRSAISEALAMTPAEVRGIGLKLRDRYDSSKVVQRMVDVFGMVMEQGMTPSNQGR